MPLRSKLFCVLALLLCSSAFAQTKVGVYYKAPTQHVDGTAITGVLTYNLYQGVQGSALVKVQTGIGGTSAAVTLGIPVGTTQCFAVTAVEAGLESAQSTPACLLITAPPNPTPGSPGTVTVTITFGP